MKTYTKQITKPRLEISYDLESDNPRTFEKNLGYFITCEKNRPSPDNYDDLQSIIENTGDDAESLDTHILFIKTRVKEVLRENVVAIYPIYCYEHGNVVYRRGTAHDFDYSNCGFYIVTDKTYRAYDTRASVDTVPNAKEIEKIIDAELEVYTAWVNGEVYMFKLYDEQGNEVNSFAGGFYSLDDIKAELGKEWENEDLSKYIINN